MRCAQGCYDAAIAYQAPFISGKDSLNNEYTGDDGQKHAIPGTLLISALGIVPDVNQSVTMDLKQAGNLLYVVGDTRTELGGSHYEMLAAGLATQSGRGQSPCPQPVPGALGRLRVLHRAIASGLVKSCHDCSEGGIGVAMAEMCLAGQSGAEISLAHIPGADQVQADDELLFSESLSRFIVEIKPEDAQAFESLCSDIPCALLGKVIPAPTLSVQLRSGAEVLSIPVSELDTAWRGHAATQAKPGASVTTKDLIAGTMPARSNTPMQKREIKRQEQPHVLILHATGTNRDQDAALACELAGGLPEIVHVNQLIAGERHLLDFGMLVIPGGFSYGDDLGAGTLWALDLRRRLGEDMVRFVAEGRPVLGICNGFQALVKAGFLPGSASGDYRSRPQTIRTVTLAQNHSAHFECRWVYLKPQPAANCIFTAGMEDLIYCPVAHGEGRVAASDADALSSLQTCGLIALTYCDPHGQPATYPGNPNGSALDIAGLTNAQGNVLGLMPHPENHVFAWQHPRHTRGDAGMSGLRLFQNGIRNA